MAMTTSTADAGAWERLGAMLIQRRTALDPRFRNRKAFCDATRLDYRLIYDIEEHRRTNFGSATLAAIEGAYALAPGAIARFLAGSGLETQADSRLAASSSLPPFNPPPVQRGTIFGDMPPEMAAKVRPLYEAINGRVQVASADRPGPLSGRHVFPDDEAAARQWDGIAARGLSIYPGQGFSADEIAQTLAAVWYLDPARQAGGDTAAGLARV
jgi:hypothetical protein